MMKTDKIIGPAPRKVNAGREAQVEIQSCRHLLSRYGYDMGVGDSLYDKLTFVLDDLWKKAHPNETE